MLMTPGWACCMHQHLLLPAPCPCLSCPIVKCNLHYCTPKIRVSVIITMKKKKEDMENLPSKQCF